MGRADGQDSYSYQGSREQAGQAGRREGLRRSYSPWQSEPCRSRDRQEDSEREPGQPAGAAGLPPPRLYPAIGPPRCPQSPLSSFQQPSSLTGATVLPSSLPPPLSGPLHSSPVRDSSVAGSQHPPLTLMPQAHFLLSCLPPDLCGSKGLVPGSWDLLPVSLCLWLSPATSDLSHRNTNSPPPG